MIIFGLLTVAVGFLIMMSNRDHRPRNPDKLAYYD